MIDSFHCNLLEILLKFCDVMQTLVSGFNAVAADGVMCRGTVSVGWDGRLYDCDFNQQLELGMRCAADTVSVVKGFAVSNPQMSISNANAGQ